jgi:hypothetical protein
MIELQISVKTSKQDDTTRTRTPKPGYLKLTIILDNRGQIALTDLMVDFDGYGRPQAANFRSYFEVTCQLFEVS